MFYFITIVVDIYSEWAGPCTGMVSILKKIKMELGGDILSYAIVSNILISKTINSYHPVIDKSLSTGKM